MKKPLTLIRLQEVRKNRKRRKARKVLQTTAVLFLLCFLALAGIFLYI